MGGTGRKTVYGGKWQAVRKKVLTRDGNRCQIGLPLICTIDATCVDHITPVAWGGEWWDLANLRAACQPCNQQLGAIARKHTPRANEVRNANGEGSRSIPQAPSSRDW